jgi:site-specific DNA-methyltransferase (adenine-specific)
LKAWGFEYKTVAFCWNKIGADGAWIHNMGRWTMGNIEICLLGVKGHPKRIVNNVKQLVIAIRNEHSKKPNVVRNRIVELMGDLPRIELFARDDGVKDMFNYNKLDGWDAWGNEIESDITLG